VAVRSRLRVPAVAALVVAGLAAAGSSSGGAAAPAPVERTCRSSVYGRLGAWQAQSIVAGSLGLVGARTFASAFRPLPAGGGRYRGSKLLVLVRTGWVVRVVVPPAQRRRVALQYDPATFDDPVAPAAGDHVVTFAACPPGRPFLGPAGARWTQFNGAIVVARRGCVELDVLAAKRGRPLPGRPQRLRVAFGRPACGA
jgi:hypothetical protein